MCTSTSRFTLAEVTALERAGVPDDVASMIAAYLSNENRRVNGQRIVDNNRHHEQPGSLVTQRFINSNLQNQVQGTQEEAFLCLTARVTLRLESSSTKARWGIQSFNGTTPP